MKKVFLVSLTAALLIGAVSCSNQEDKKIDSESIDVAEETAEPMEKITVLALNDGHKWEVNAEMKEYPQNCKALVEKYVESKDTDFKMLADQLAGQNKKLIGSCTMNGRSHDALHLWLEPNLSLVTELSSSNNEQEADAVVLKLQDSYTLYDRFFQ